MKMSKKIRTLVSTALISAMVLTMGGMSAFAATANDPLTSVTMTKTVTTDGHTFAPDATFTFTLDEGAATSVSNNVVFAGIEGGLTFENGTDLYKKDLVYKASMSEVPRENYDTTAKILVDKEKFTVPGIYHYTIQETKGSYEGITYDTTLRDLYVYVERNTEDKVYVAAIVIDGKAIEEGKASLTFTNDYGKDSDTTHDVIIAKTVTGNQGDRKADYHFYVTVNAKDDANEFYYVEYGTATADGDFTSGTPTTVLESGKKADIVLKHGEAIRIYGLSDNDTYVVEEYEKVAGDLSGYTTKINGVEDEDRKTDSLNTSSDGAKVLYENNKEVTTPTGIVMTFGPYVLLIALAGVFATLFFRRKREEF